MSKTCRSSRAVFRFIVIAVFFCLTGGRPAHGQTVSTWLGGSNVSWATTGNWSNNAVPGTTTNVVYSSTSANLVGQLLGANRSVNGITVGTVSGSVTIAAGSTLTVGNGGVDMSAATGNFIVNTAVLMTGSNATWNIASGRNFQLSSTIDLTGTFSLTGGGTTTLNGVNAYTRINAGTLVQLGSGASLQIPAGNQNVSLSGTIVNNGGVFTSSFTSNAGLQVGRGAGGTFGAFVQNSGTSTIASLSAGGYASGEAGSVVINGGVSSLTISGMGYGALGRGRLTVNGGSVTVPSFAGIATGSGATSAITLSGGTTTLNAAFPTTARGTGATSTFTFDGGVYRPGAANLTILQNLTSASITDNGAIIDSNGFSTTIAQVLENGTAAGTNGTLTKLGSGTLSLTAANTYTGATTINAGVLQIGAGGTTGSLNPSSVISGSAGATLAFNRTNTVTQGTDFGSGLIGPFNVAQNGSGTVLLNGTNTYSGTTSVNAGILQFTGTSALYSGSSASWTKANITTATNATFAVNVGGAGEFSTSNVTTLLTNLTGDVSTGGIKGGSRIGFDTTNASGGTFTVADVIANTVGTGSGTLGVTKLGTGVLVLSATNTFTGPITINSGTLQVGGSGVLGGGSYTTGTMSIASGAALLYTSSQAQTLGNNSNILTGGGDFIMQAPNTTLNNNLGNPTFTGRFFILSGSVFQGFTNGFGGGTVYLGDTSGANNATLYAGFFPRTSSAPIVVQAGNTGTSTIAALKSSGAGGDYAHSGAVTLNKTLTVVANAPGSGTNSVSFSGQVTGTGGISLAGNVGLVTLSNSNSYTGPTAVSGGFFQLSNQFAAQNSTLNVTSGSVVFNSGVAAKAFTIGGLAGSGTVTLANNAGSPAAIALTVGNNNADTAFTGRLIGAGGLTKVGTGLLALSGSSTYLGATNVSAGRLAVNGWLDSAVTVALDGTLGGSGRLTSNIGGDGLIAPGNSPGILQVDGQVIPTALTSFAFEFTQTGDPIWSNATASVNDVLRLTNSSPFQSSLTSTNIVNVYFDVASLAGGDIFTGGFYSDRTGGQLDFAAAIGAPTYAFYVFGDGNGSNPYNGKSYYTFSEFNPSLAAPTVSVVTVGSANYANGTIANGQVTQFVIAVPEPAAVALAGIGVGIAGWAAARRRYRRKHG